MPDTVVVSSKNSSDRQTLSEDFRNALEVIMDNAILSIFHAFNIRQFCYPLLNYW